MGQLRRRRAHEQRVADVDGTSEPAVRAARRAHTNVCWQGKDCLGKPQPLSGSCLEPPHPLLDFEIRTDVVELGELRLQ